MANNNPQEHSPDPKIHALSPPNIHPLPNPPRIRRHRSKRRLPGRNLLIQPGIPRME